MWSEGACMGTQVSRFFDCRYIRYSEAMATGLPIKWAKVVAA